MTTPRSRKRSKHVKDVQTGRSVIHMDDSWVPTKQDALVSYKYDLPMVVDYLSAGKVEMSFYIIIDRVVLNSILHSMMYIYAQKHHN